MNLVLIAICVLCILSFLWYISDLKTGVKLSHIGWWWTFLIIGSILTLYTYKNRLPEEENKFSNTIDLFIGVMGGVGLLSLGILIFISSSTHLFPSYKKQSIVELDGITKTKVLTGWLILSQPYTSLSYVSFDRKKDTLTFVGNSGGIDSFIMLGKKISYEEQMAEWLEPLYIQDRLYKVSVNGLVFSGNTLLKGSQQTKWEKAILTYNENTGTIFSEKASWGLSFTWKIENPLLSRNGTTLIWEEKKDGKTNLWKQGLKLGVPYDKVIKTYVSGDGKDVISLVENNNRMEVIKNGETVDIIPKEYLSESFTSNGSEYFYTIMKENVMSIVINGYQWEKKYEEVRDVFLEEDGYSYAYFARPLGEKTYCLFTRYKGNLCGLSAYMNPKIWADGGSILFAGQKSGTWSIYRNIEKIVKDTGYASENISYDYVFFDITNPRTFLFIKKDITTGNYILIKNGILLSQKWKDVGTDVSFWFDNQIILTVQDETWWHILQI